MPGDLQALVSGGDAPTPLPVRIGVGPPRDLVAEFGEGRRAPCCPSGKTAAGVYARYLVRTDAPRPNQENPFLLTRMSTPPACSARSFSLAGTAVLNQPLAGHAAGQQGA